MAAARRCGVNEKTLRRWMAEDAAVKLALTKARTAMCQIAMDRVQVLTVEAIDTLAKLMRKKTAPTVRLRGDSARANAAKCRAKDAQHRDSPRSPT